MADCPGDLHGAIADVQVPENAGRAYADSGTATTNIANTCVILVARAKPVYHTTGSATLIGTSTETFKTYLLFMKGTFHHCSSKQNN